MTGNDGETWVEPTDGAIESAADALLAFDGAVDRPVVKAIDGTVERIAWVSRPDDLDEPTLGFLLEHWQGLAAARGGLPDRRDLDVLDLVPAIGNLIVLEAERDGFDAIYRLYGTGIVGPAGRDWTGFRVSEMNRMTRTAAALMYRCCYRAVSRRPAPLFTEHAASRLLGVRLWRRLILPLADGGTGCARYLVGTLPVGRRHLSGAALQEQRRRARGR